MSYGPVGMSHHATEDLAILRALPGIEVFSPGDLWEAEEVSRYLVGIADLLTCGWINLRRRRQSGRRDISAGPNSHGSRRVRCDTGRHGRHSW